MIYPATLERSRDLFARIIAACPDATNGELIVACIGVASVLLKDAPGQQHLPDLDQFLDLGAELSAELLTRVQQPTTLRES
jgi:hypothetical protein